MGPKSLFLMSIGFLRAVGKESRLRFIQRKGNERDCRTKQSSAQKAGDAFTLTELLVVVAIVGILVALLIPSTFAFLDRAMAAKCTGNLKSMGSAIRLSSSENNGKWVIMDSMFGTWEKMLLDRGFLSASGASFCPSFSPKSYAQYQTYGITWQGVALAPDDHNIITYLPPAGQPGSRTYYDINLMAISKPSKYILMADSYTTRFKSQYHIVQGGTIMDEIHLRHNNRANVLFADGHVDALTATGLHDVGWSRAFDNKGTLTNF